MNRYDDESHEIIDVGQHCNQFKKTDIATNKVESSEMSVSCMNCKHWNTDGCISESYEGALRCMEKNQ